MKKYLLLLAIFIAISSCSKDEYAGPASDASYIVKEVDKIVEVVKEVPTTVTVNVPTPVAPPDYDFNRKGVSTVYYTGQTNRLKMAAALGAAMNSNTSTKEKINNMFNNGEGFDDATLNGTGKKVGNKTGAYGSATVKPIFDTWITDFVDNVIPAWNNDAAKGVAGKYTDPGKGGRSVYINKQGKEYNQLFMKGLIGGMANDQIINGYLSKTKLNSVKDDNDNGVFGYTSPGSAEPNVTKMEHYWDEGFGYLYGLDNQTDPKLGASGDVLLNKYLKKVNASDEPGIAKKINDAFTLGRAAITAKNYTLRDEQADIIKVELSKVIGYKAAYYMYSGGANIEAGKWANALHALSEGYGFILSLQYTQKADGTPYMDNAAVNALLAELDKGDGFWDHTKATLGVLGKQISDATGLVPQNAY
jgi:hypothetical protein